MRIRLLLAGVAVAIMALLGPAHAAFAANEPNYKTDVEKECAEKLADGAALKECDSTLEAPSPILPATNEIVWGALSFLILFVLLYKFGFPALKKGMGDRADRIRTDLDRAETAKTEAEAKLAEYEAQLQGAKHEATQMREDARSETEEYKTQRKQEIDTELAEYRERA